MACKYCGQSFRGRYCPESPHGCHEWPADDARVCVFCGGSNYGDGCGASPDSHHRHGVDGHHCIWCGQYFAHPSNAISNFCSYRPGGGKHQLG